MGGEYGHLRAVVRRAVNPREKSETCNKFPKVKRRSLSSKAHMLRLTSPSLPLPIFKKYLASPNFSPIQLHDTHKTSNCRKLQRREDQQQHSTSASPFAYLHRPLFAEPLLPDYNKHSEPSIATLCIPSTPLHITSHRHQTHLSTDTSVNTSANGQRSSDHSSVRSVQGSRRAPLPEVCDRSRCPRTGTQDLLLQQGLPGAGLGCWPQARVQSRNRPVL